MKELLPKRESVTESTALPIVEPIEPKIPPELDELEPEGVPDPEVPEPEVPEPVEPLPVELDAQVLD
jgi:hypothetical protein